MSIFRFLVLLLTCSFVTQADANSQGDNFIKLGQKINRTSGLNSSQISQLNKILTDAEDVLNNVSVNEGYVCITGTLYGPNKFEKWTGDTNACSNPNKIKIGRNYACAVGTLYGPNKLEKWTGDTDACGKPNKIAIGTNYACAVGTIYGPGGFEKWTGDTDYCGKAILD